MCENKCSSGRLTSSAAIRASLGSVRTQPASATVQYRADTCNLQGTPVHRGIPMSVQVVQVPVSTDRLFFHSKNCITCLLPSQRRNVSPHCNPLQDCWLSPTLVLPYMWLGLIWPYSNSLFFLCRWMGGGWGWVPKLFKHFQACVYHSVFRGACCAHYWNLK